MRNHKKAAKKSFQLVLIVFACLANIGLAQAQVPADSSPDIEARVDAMLGKLTLAQKLALIGGEDDMYIRAMPEVGLPRLKMSDGPVGVRTWGPSTSYAGGIGLAATWDPAMAQSIGAALGEDARARGVNFLLGPGVNIYRAPINGRNLEYFGEDPYLASRMVVAYINGVQSKGVVATVKHYAANNSEYDRHNIDTIIDERTLREIYLPAFEAAVKEAHVGAVMDSYNLLNGEHLTQNKRMNDDILKKEWRFSGILMSDWSATYDGVAAANSGLDLEMPDGKFMSPQVVGDAVRSGQVSVATIDDKVRRILRVTLRFGFLDRQQLDPMIPLYRAASNQVALQSARESMVLLKNEHNLLPLNRDAVHTIAVIGPDAYPAVPGGGGSSNTTAFAPVSFLQGVGDYLGTHTRVLYAGGLPTPQSLFHETRFEGPNGQHGLKLETFDGPETTGPPTSTTSVDNVDQFKPEMWTPAATVRRTLRWTGSYTPAKTGTYLFLTGAASEDAYKLLVDGKQLLVQPKREGQAPQFATLPLVAGKPVSVELLYQPDSTSIRMGFGIRNEEDLISPETRKIAAASDAVVVAVGFDPPTESEGYDRSFSLPWGQDALIRAVAAANPKTVVNITAGGAVDTRNWLDHVPVLIHNWYPGQQGGRALAEVLFGDQTPEGKLPMSFDRSWDEDPTHDHYYPETGKSHPTVTYAEGVFLGYRYYTSMQKQPLYPFGFGLSYTTFSFNNLKVTPASNGATRAFDVSFDVKNTGQRSGAEVAQVYVGDPSASIKRPVKELKGFKKVRLDPGKSEHVTLQLDQRALSYYDANEKGWRVDPGMFKVFVGDSSEDTPLTAEFTVLGSANAADLRERH